MEEFDDRAFTERVDKIVTTEGEALEFHFYDGAVKEVPIMLFRPDHIASRGAHLPFPGYTWTQAGYSVIPEEAGQAADDKQSKMGGNTWQEQ